MTCARAPNVAGREQGHAQVLGSLKAERAGTRTPTPSPKPDLAGGRACQTCRRAMVGPDVAASGQVRRGRAGGACEDWLQQERSAG